MISQTAEYALRAIVYLASKTEASQTTPEIAAATKVPAGYLAKVMQALGRAGLVHSQRGLGGGFVLAKAAGELTGLDGIQGVDPFRRIRRRPLGLNGRINPCPLHLLL